MNKKKITTIILILVIISLLLLMITLIKYEKEGITFYKYADDLYKVIKNKLETTKVEDVSVINANNIEEILGIKLENVKSITITYDDSKELVISIEADEEWENEVIQVKEEEVKEIGNEDVIAPIITLNGYKKINLSLGEIFTDPGINIVDNTDGDISNKVIISNNVNPNVVGTYTITYTIYDSSGNKSISYREIEIKDTIAPVITLNGNKDININKGNVYNDDGATAKDNYDGDITNKIVTTNNIDISKIGTYYVKYNVTDNGGNKANEVTRNVTVIENIPVKPVPVITLLGSKVITLEYGMDYVDLGATATDGIDGNITNKIVVNSNVDTSKTGTYYVKYNVTNSSLNKAIEATRIVLVLDKKVPTITLNGNSTTEIEVGSTYVDLGATATDEYNGDLTSKIIVSNNVNSNIIGTYYVKYNVSDTSNNIALEAVRVVHVKDNTRPIITLNGESTITIEGGNNYTESGATAVDNYDGDLTSSIIVTGSVNPNVLGTYYIRYNVKDSSNNTALEAVRTIVITDTVNPIIISEIGEEIEIEVFSEYIEPGATAIDNFDGDISDRIIKTGEVNTSIIGTYTIRYNVVDNAGNDAPEVVRIIHVVDTTKPVITINGVSTIDIERMSSYEDLGATATDNYDGNITGNIVITSNVDTTIVGTYLVTYNVVDSSGNLAQEVIRTVNIVDTTIPLVTLNGNSTIEIEVGSSYTELGATAIDNGSTNITNRIVISGTVNSNIIGTYYIRYNVSDLSGNDAIEVVRTINIVDTTIPVITLTGDSTIEFAVNSEYIEPGATAIDNFDGNITSNILITNLVNMNVIGTYYVRYNVTDSSGNNAVEVTRTVNVVLSVITSGYNPSKGVNVPELVTGMVPIVWNDTTWVETTINDVNWYNYNNVDKKWANARTADGSMWVWIPRYAYKITSNYHTYVDSNTAGNIDIKFLMNDTINTSDSTSIVDTLSGGQTTADVFVKHPAFKFGSKELNGIWVAKFEASANPAAGSTNYTGSCTGTDDTSTAKVIKVIPNATAWRCVSFSNKFTVSLNMQTRTDIYGWNQNEVDTHMMKNIEWGATLYLTRSQYGKNNEKIWKNNENHYTTGCYGTTANASTTSGCQRQYSDTTYGVNGSTTGNIYGVYDMNGGSWEAVAAYVNNGNASLTNASFSSIYNADPKYKDVYSIGTTDTSANNYAALSTKYGDAMWETSTNASTSSVWHGGIERMGNGASPWILRGSEFGAMYSAYAFDYVYTALDTGFRPVLLIGSDL